MENIKSEEDQGVRLASPPVIKSRDRQNRPIIGRNGSKKLIDPPVTTTTTVENTTSLIDLIDTELSIDLDTTSNIVPINTLSLDTSSTISDVQRIAIDATNDAIQSTINKSVHICIIFYLYFV